MSLILRPWTPPASLTRLKTASIPALMLTPQFATAPVRSTPAPTTISFSVTPVSAQAGRLLPTISAPMRTASTAPLLRNRFIPTLLRIVPGVPLECLTVRGDSSVGMPVNVERRGKTAQKGVPPCEEGLDAGQELGPQQKAG